MMTAELLRQLQIENSNMDNLVVEADFEGAAQMIVRLTSEKGS